MRRIRSESCTFIWQPKVRMHAVFVPSEAPGATKPPRGFLENGIGATVGGVPAASLILVLRLVDAGSHGDLSRTAPKLDLPQLQVASPRRPPKYIRDATLVLLTDHEHRPIAHTPSPLALRPDRPTLPVGDAADR